MMYGCPRLIEKTDAKYHKFPTRKQLVENLKTASHDIDTAPIILLHKIVEVLEQTPWRNLKKNSKSLLDRYHGLYLTKLKGFHYSSYAPML